MAHRSVALATVHLLRVREFKSSPLFRPDVKSGTNFRNSSAKLGRFTLQQNFENLHFPKEETNFDIHKDHVFTCTSFLDANRNFWSIFALIFRPSEKHVLSLK